LTLEHWLRVRSFDYQRRARALHGARRRIGARNIAAFVLFTPRQTYERALIEWRAWRYSGEVRGSFANRRRTYIDALPASNRWYARRRGETAAAWQARFEALPGLGPAKAPFLCSLLAPLQDDTPVCLDVWMLRALGARNPDKPSARSFRWARRKLARLTRESGWLPFPFQWAVWDYVRTADGSERTAYVNQTDIATDLEVAHGE